VGIGFISKVVSKRFREMPASAAQDLCRKGERLRQLPGAHLGALTHEEN
jgi:hypothetical protein